MKSRYLHYASITLLSYIMATSPFLSMESGCDSVTALYDYSYLKHGAMFDVIAHSDITLDHLTANIKNGTAYYSIQSVQIN